MKIFMLTREGMDYSRPAAEFAEMVRRRYPDREVEVIDLDTRLGAQKARTYEIVQYPAIIATAEDGRPLEIWQGMPVPLIDEVMGAVLK